MMDPLPEGTSEPYDVALFDDGAALVGTGLDVELVIVTSEGEDVGSPAPTAAWLNQTTGTVRITGAEILTLGQYAVRFKLTDGGGKVGYVPNKDQWETWEVVKVVP